MDVDNSRNNFSEDISHIKESATAHTIAQMTNCKKEKKPRKILHFSDGILEEYSTDEEEEETEPKLESIEIDPKRLSWAEWVGYWAKNSGKTALDTCDSVGGSIANILGITSPKYFYEIEEYKRIVKEESDEKIKIDEEMSGWSSPRNQEAAVQEVSVQEIYKISSGTDLPLVQFSQQ